MLGCAKAHPYPVFIGSTNQTCFCMPVQTDDKWLATTYNSMPECGGEELQNRHAQL